MAVLSLCYALSVTSIALNAAAGPVVGAALAPNPSLATLPITLALLGTMASSLPASLLMARFGRRAGFMLGTFIGMAGALAAVAGIVRGSFLLLCVGLLGVGALNGFSQLYRFAAADAAPMSGRARAISWVLAGGVAAGVVGPPLGAAAKDAFPAARFAGSYALMLVLYLVVLAILLRLRLAPPVEEEARRAPRPLGAIVSQARFQAAVACSMVAYGVMALVMTAAPLSIQAEGHSFDNAAFVIQAHIVAMFAPSFVTGRLIARFGVHRVATAGLGSLAASVAVALAGTSVAHFWTALVFLGVGWNFLFVSGTTLLTQTHRTAERGKVQGLNDLLVFGTAAGASLAAGHVQNSVGWHGLQVGLAPALVMAAGLLAVLGLLVRARRVPPEGPQGLPSGPDA